MGKETGNGPQAAKEMKDGRRARAAQALRANLQRRKAQARAREDAQREAPRGPVKD